MFDLSNIWHFYFDVLFTSFSVIILFGVLIAVPVGIFALKSVKMNLWGTGIAFVLFSVSLLIICYTKITLKALVAAIVAADVLLGIVIGFLIAVAVLVYRERVNAES